MCNIDGRDIASRGVRECDTPKFSMCYSLNLQMVYKIFTMSVKSSIGSQNSTLICLQGYVIAL